MRLKTLVEAKIQNVQVKFKPVTLSNGKQMMSIITNNGKRFVIEASRKNFDHFKNWPKGTEKEFIDADIKPTIRSIYTIDGDKIRTVKIRTEFEMPAEYANQNYDNDDLVF
ncbi:MAG TPA: hypothetical protein VMZ91_10710 [Candidatus Paceibacterota bacterium]|nr:hypothetical protein [Candidatus Paceibacterota bacterium]